MTSPSPHILPSLTLLPGRDRSARGGHPWIFSGAFRERPPLEPGALVEVRSAEGERVGAGMYHPLQSITVRLLAFGDDDPVASLTRNLDRALQLRQQTLPPDVTGYRIVNGEADGIPSLVVDRYDTVLVVQSGTIGMDHLLPTVTSLLISRCQPSTILERSTGSSRRTEGLSNRIGVLHGAPVEETVIDEYGKRLIVSFTGTQKTGFFLDQREMRRLVGEIFFGTVANCFSFSGGFSVHADNGKVTHLTSIDVSEDALRLCERNLNENGCSIPHDEVIADVFQYLREVPDRWDCVVLDPPAFAKQARHHERALAGYREINAQAFRHILPGGILLTCSCSHHISAEDFQGTVLAAARDARRSVRIISLHRLAPDHPINPAIPESAYLKSILLAVD